MKHLCVLIVLVGLVLAGAACGGAAAPTAAPTPAATSAKQAPAKKWVKVAGLEGSGTATSAPFRLKGGQQKLTYAMKGTDMPTAAFYVVAKGTDLLEEGGFPVATLSKTGRATETFSRPKGSYVIIVNASECTWSCTVSELR